MKYFKFYIVILFLISFPLSLSSIVYASPSIVDPNFEIKELITGLNFPVQMEFIGNDILVIQKNDGNVRIIRDGQLQDEPILHFDVESRGLEGLLGVEVVESNVYFYVTQLTQNKEEPEVNRIYLYKWDGNNLIDGKLINELPGNPTYHDHVGGVLTSDDDKNVYAVIGDLYRRGFLQNGGTEESVDNTHKVIHMNDTTSSFGDKTFKDRQIQAEFITPTSQLVEEKIDTITLKLRKVGNPTGIVQIGVFNDDLSVKKLFDTINPATLFNYYTDYTFSLSSETYTIASGDRIGVKFNEGDSSNYIETVMDTIEDESFDDANSYYTYYENGWLSFPTNDMYMILTQSKGDSTPKVDDSGIILRVGLDKSVKRPYQSDNPFKHYYAVGIRNSYGLTFDPITGYMWETENGPEDHDEINLVFPGFNSGWSKIMGKATKHQLEELPGIQGFTYSDPKFAWEVPVGVTQLVFPLSDNFKTYNNTVFVGNVMTNVINKFELNPTRTGFVFKNPDLGDLELNKSDNVNEIIFATGFNGIVDLDMGPDGNLYVLTIYDGGSIYKISPISSEEITSPKKQTESGVTLRDVECHKRLVLIKKIAIDEVACIRPSSMSKLFERNWGEFLDEPISHHCSSPPSPGIDWSNCDFSFSNISNANLSNANLSHGNFVGSILTKINLNHSNLEYGDFTSANLSGSDLSNSNITVVKLTQANLQNVNLSNTDLSKSSLAQVSLIGSNISNAKLNGSYLIFSNLQNTDFSGTDLSGVSLAGSNFNGVVFRNANLTQANFGDANLSNAILEGCYGNSLCDE